MFKSVNIALLPVIYISLIASILIAAPKTLTEQENLVLGTANLTARSNITTYITKTI